MAVLKTADGQIHTDANAINRLLQPLNIHIRKLPLGQYLKNPEAVSSLQAIFDRDTLDLHQKQTILKTLSTSLAKAPKADEHLWCELMIVGLSSPNLYQLLSQGSRPHHHPNDEALYVLSGECVWGFLGADGHQLELMVQAHEYIKVPAGLRHWFSLSASLHVKAMRFFVKTKTKQIIPHLSN